MRNSRYITAAVVVLVVFVLLLLFLNYRRAQNRSGLVDAAIATAETLFGFYRGINTVDVLHEKHGGFLSSSLRAGLENFDLALRQLEDVYVDLDALYAMELSLEDRVEVGSPPVVDDIPKIVNVGGIGAEEPMFSPLVVSINGVRKIKASKLEFRASGIAYVLFNGRFLEIARGTVPESYEMMLRNPRHVYRYTGHLVNLTESTGFIDVLLVSILDGRPERVRIRIKNGRVAGFEVG